MLTRRQLLRGLCSTGLGAVGLGAVGLAPRRASADTLASGKRLVVVVANGGWDVTRVFAPTFDIALADMEPEASAAQVGDMPFVDHPDRPGVRRFLEQHHARTAIVNGLLVPSVAHQACQGLLLTGGTAGRDPDWATRIASAQRDAYALPHMLLGSVGFAGHLTEVTARVGRRGQLDGLMDGSLLAQADQPAQVPEDALQELADGYQRRRIQAELDGSLQGAEAQLYEDMLYAHHRALELRQRAGAVNIVGRGSLTEQAEVAVQALAQGISRCVTIQHPNRDILQAWDSHTENDTFQGILFEELFLGLGALLEGLEQSAGSDGGSLLEQTVVAVVSEMGRTPWLTPSEGKDHWPYTSAMLVGAGVAGNQVIGGLDERFYGRPIDPVSGALRDGGLVINGRDLGATLLALCGEDPGQVEQATVIEALLA